MKCSDHTCCCVPLVWGLPFPPGSWMRWRVLWLDCPGRLGHNWGQRSVPCSSRRWAESGRPSTQWQQRVPPKVRTGAFWPVLVGVRFIYQSNIFWFDLGQSIKSNSSCFCLDIEDVGPSELRPQLFQKKSTLQKSRHDTFFLMKSQISSKIQNGRSRSLRPCKDRFSGKRSDPFVCATAVFN